MTLSTPDNAEQAVNAAPKPTCASCKHMGQSYWGSDYDYGGRTHFCGKESERRRDQMKPTGDFAEDFMRNFRTFFDAKANNAACNYFEEREPLSVARLGVLTAMLENAGKGAFAFLSPENRLCEEMQGLFVERDETAARQRKPSDGTRDWKLSRVGEPVAKAAASRLHHEMAEG